MNPSTSCIIQPIFYRFINKNITSNFVEQPARILFMFSSKTERQKKYELRHSAFLPLLTINLPLSPCNSRQAPYMSFCFLVTPDTFSIFPQKEIFHPFFHKLQLISVQFISIPKVSGDYFASFVGAMPLLPFPIDVSFVPSSMLCQIKLPAKEHRNLFVGPQTLADLDFQQMSVQLKSPIVTIVCFRQAAGHLLSRLSIINSHDSITFVFLSFYSYPNTLNKISMLWFINFDGGTWCAFFMCNILTDPFF